MTNKETILRGTFRLNHERQGVELQFAGIPAQFIRDGLKETKLWYFGGKNRPYWYAKTDKTPLVVAMAQLLGDPETAEAAALPIIAQDWPKLCDLAEAEGQNLIADACRIMLDGFADHETILSAYTHTTPAPIQAAPTTPPPIPDTPPAAAPVFTVPPAIEPAFPMPQPVAAPAPKLSRFQRMAAKLIGLPTPGQQQAQADPAHDMQHLESLVRQQAQATQQATRKASPQPESGSFQRHTSPTHAPQIVAPFTLPTSCATPGPAAAAVAVQAEEAPAQVMAAPALSLVPDILPEVEPDTTEQAEAPAVQYSVSDNDELDHDLHKMQIVRRVSLKGNNIADLISLPLHELLAALEASKEREKELHQALADSCKEWEAQAAETARLQEAIQYCQVGETKHTANKVKKTEHGFEVSNRVYAFWGRISESEERSEGPKWHVSWALQTNGPKIPSYGGRFITKLAGQDRKLYRDEAAAKAYLQGRLQAHADYFTELNPAIPADLVKFFELNNHLLPGYRVERSAKGAKTK